SGIILPASHYVRRGRVCQGNQWLRLRVVGAIGFASARRRTAEVRAASPNETSPRVTLAQQRQTVMREPPPTPKAPEGSDGFVKYRYDVHN
ncbi:hypothetical protein SB758_35050, partial [Burkholderia sp. SIMBA_013]